MVHFLQCQCEYLYKIQQQYNTRFDQFFELHNIVHSSWIRFYVSFGYYSRLIWQTHPNFVEVIAYTLIVWNVKNYIYLLITDKLNKKCISDASGAGVNPTLLLYFVRYSICHLFYTYNWWLFSIMYVWVLYSLTFSSNKQLQNICHLNLQYPESECLMHQHQLFSLY